MNKREEPRVKGNSAMRLSYIRVSPCTSTRISKLSRHQGNIHYSHFTHGKLGT